MALPEYYRELRLSALKNENLTPEIGVWNDLFETSETLTAQIQRSDLDLSSEYLDSLSMTLDTRNMQAPVSAAVSANISAVCQIQAGYENYVSVIVNTEYSNKDPQDLVAFILSARKNTPSDSFQVEAFNERYGGFTSHLSITLRILPEELRWTGTGYTPDASSPVLATLSTNMSCDFVHSAESPQLYFMEPHMSWYAGQAVPTTIRLIRQDSAKQQCRLSTNVDARLNNYAQVSTYVKFYRTAYWTSPYSPDEEVSGLVFNYEISEATPDGTVLSLDFSPLAASAVSAQYLTYIDNDMVSEPSFDLAENVEYDSLSRTFTIYVDPNSDAEGLDQIKINSATPYSVEITGDANPGETIKAQP